MKNHIPYGQVFRAKRICTKEEDLELAIGNIRQNFINRGYPQKIIDEQIVKAKTQDRETLLFYNSEQCDDGLRFCTTQQEFAKY